MASYRKKPVVVEAFQYTEELRDSMVLDSAPVPPGLHFSGANWHQGDRRVWSARYYVYGIHGQEYVSIGDWIVGDGQGEYIRCEADEFASTYELAGEGQ